MLKEKVLSFYKGNITRYDKEFGFYYFEPSLYKDFAEEKFNFYSNENERLSGFIYSYPNFKDDKLVIFAPGIGPGHISYIREIELIARQGFKVISLDYTGTGESDGSTIRSMAQSLADLDCLFKYLNVNNLLNNKEVTVIGHSFGGYAASNIRNYHKSIQNVVVMAGYISIKQFIKPFLHGFKAPFRRYIYDYEKEQNKNYYKSSAITAIKNKDTNFLFFQSDNDQVIKCEYNALLISKNTNKFSNVKTVITKGKGHNLNYTIDGVLYMKDAFNKYNSLVKEKKLISIDDKKNYLENLDWKRMTEQDMEIWDEIFNLINNK